MKNIILINKVALTIALVGLFGNVWAAEPPPTSPPPAAATPSANVFAQALIMSQQLEAKGERLQGCIYDSAITSDEIAALRKKNSALNLQLSGQLLDADRERLTKEQQEAQAQLTKAVMAHPVVQKFLTEIANDKEKLMELHQQIKKIRAHSEQGGHDD